MSEPSKPQEMLPRAPSNADPMTGPRADLARVIPRRPRVAWWMMLVLAVGFAALVMPIITADRWIGGSVVAGKAAPITVRVPPFAGYDTRTAGHIGGGGGGVVIARGDAATRDDEINTVEIAEAMPHGPAPYLAFFALAAVFAFLFSHHTRRSTRGRLVRVQLVNLALIAVAAVAVKIAMLTTATNVLIVPVAVFALLPTLVLDRVVGLATGTLAALAVSLLVPFDVGVAILLLVQVATAGLVVAERPKQRLRATIAAGAAATLFTALTYPLFQYLTTGHLPLAELHTPLKSAWVAAALGPAIATAIAVPLIPAYQLLVGEITQGKLIELEDLSQPLLKQIAERSPGTWQHSLMMANMAEIAANAIGANGRLVRVGAYYHDLGKSLTPKYFIENLEPGETSPHDKLPPEVSCDAIFAHVTEGIVTARRSGLHERIVDFMHMHHGNGVLEYFWAKCKEQGNPNQLTVEHFRYPGVPPQSRETAILAICDAVEAASRTIKKAEPTAIDNLVQRIVYGKLHLGQLDDSGLSMGDLRRVADSLRETIRHANHGRIEYPWQKAEQSASASVSAEPLTATGPRLDSLDRPAKPDSVRPATKPATGDDALAATDAAGATPRLRKDNAASGPAKPRDSSELALLATTPVKRPSSPEVRRDVGREVHEQVLRESAERGQKLSARPSDVPRPSAEDVPRPIDPDFERSAAIAAKFGNRPPASRDSNDRTLPVELVDRDSDVEIKIEPAPTSDMSARYANDPPASRDSSNRTVPLERVERRDSDPMISRDGTPHLEHSKPSDTGSLDDSARARPIKRTDDTGERRKSTGDFVAQMMLEPLAAPRDFATDIDTGKHKAALAAKDSSKEIAQFTKDATQALDAAAKDIDVLPPGADTPSARSSASAPPPGAPTLLRTDLSARSSAPALPTDLSARSSASTLPAAGEPGQIVVPAPETPSAVRKRAATIPPTPDLIRPPAVQSPRRAPTVPPAGMPNVPPPPRASRPPTEPGAERPPATTLFGSGAGDLRAPAAPIARDPSGPAKRAALVIDDEARTSQDDDAVRTQPLVPPGDDAARTNPALPRTDDAARTNPAMPKADETDEPQADDTLPRLDLPLPAPAMSDPGIRIEPPAPRRDTWARGLAARIDAKLDDDFGTETPVSAPTRAELQALLDTPPDATRKQSVEELERLHRAAGMRRSEPELDFTRRAPYPTAEVAEEDIESAIEIAPSARRTTSSSIGIAKKKPGE